MATNTIDTPQTIRFLNRAFRQATDRLSNKNTAGTRLHQYQVKFSYIIDDIQRGPVYMIPKKISQANDLIKEINDIRTR